MDQSRSPEVAKLLEINWIDAEWPMQFSNGYGKTPMPLSALFELSAEKNRPALVYVHATIEDSEKAAKVESDLFGSEDLVIGSRFFRFYRIDAADVTDEGVKEKYLKKLPAFILLDNKGNEVELVNGRTSHRSIYGKMAKVFSDQFSSNFKSHVTRAAKQLKEMERLEDKVADARRFVDFCQERVTERATPQSERQLAEKTAELEVAVKAFEDARAKLDVMLSPATEEVAKN